MGEGTLARRYKLRLGDGTILAVDFEGLTVWLMDKQAMVQTAGARDWRPLKEVIAEVRVAAKYAARERRQSQEPENKSKKARGGRDALPLVPPPSRTGQTPRSPSEAPVVDEVSPEDALIGAPADVQTLADDPGEGGAASPPDDTPVIPLKPLEDETPGPAAERGVAAPPREPTGVVEELIEVAGEAAAPRESEEEGPFGDAFIDESPGAPPPTVAADEPAAAQSPDGPPMSPPGPSEDDLSRLVDSLEGSRVDDALIAVPPDLGGLADAPPAVTEAARDAPEPPSSRPSESRAIGTPPAGQPLADEPRRPSAAMGANALSPAPPGDALAIALERSEDGSPAEPTESPAGIRVVVHDPVTRSEPGPGGEGGARPLPPSAPPAVDSSPQVLADDVGGPSGARSTPASPPVDRLPVIPMKPLEDETSHPGTGGGADVAGGGPHGLRSMLLAAVGAVGAFFSRCLEPITRLERGQPLVDDEAPPVLGPSLQRLRTAATDWAGGVRQRAGQRAEHARGPRSDPSDSTVTPPGGDPTPSRLASTLGATTSALASLARALMERARSLLPSPRDEDAWPSTPDPTPVVTPPPEDEASSISPVSLRVEPLATSVEQVEPTPPAPAVSVSPEPPPSVSEPAKALPAPSASPKPRPPTSALPTPVTSPIEAPRPAPVRSEPATPLPPTGDLEVLPFAERPELGEPSDVYEGDDTGGLPRVAWAWAKSLGLIAVVVAGGIFTVVSWRTWFPTAAHLGEATFTEVDRVAKAPERAERLQQAVDAAALELPHLGPETIRLVLSSSPIGLPEASEAFRIAGDAADRGLGTLTVAEATDLEALRGELSDGLGPLEREQLGAYARTRARRIVFAEEHVHALALVARGARTLPPERRERLQVLLGKAIAAGLGPPAPARPPSGGTTTGSE